MDNSPEITPLTTAEKEKILARLYKHIEEKFAAINEELELQAAIVSDLAKKDFHNND